MWPFKKKEAKPVEPNYQLAMIEKMQEWRSVGEEFEYLAVRVKDRGQEPALGRHRQAAQFVGLAAHAPHAFNFFRGIDVNVCHDYLSLRE